MQNIKFPKSLEKTELFHDKLVSKKPVYWEVTGKNRALNLFKKMARNVPAYKKFLTKNRINPDQITSYSELREVPSLDKENYLKVYEKSELMWGGEFGKGSWIISTTSGSSGKPYYFPRQSLQDDQYAAIAEQYLLSNFDIKNKSTLYIVGFPMGAWIGGVFTYQAVKQVADKGYNLSLITPGIHKHEIINAVKELSEDFDQIIIGSYAPFLKDIIHDGKESGINWKNLNVKFIFSAEAFTENFRDFVANETGLENIYTDTLNHYGTVDQGTMAHETPLSVFIRRKLVEENLLGEVFHESHRQPTLCQYVPDLYLFDEKDSNLFCTSASGIPLVNYDLKDYGGIIPFTLMIEKLKNLGIDILGEAKKSGLIREIWQLPFVYVYERNDFSVSYYAFNVYPDPIRKAINNEKFSARVTGKFSMEVQYKNSGRQKLLIHVESYDNPAKKSYKLLENEIQKTVHQILLKESSEYPEIFSSIGSDVMPVIEVHRYEDPTYFKPGGKQKWVLK